MSNKKTNGKPSKSLEDLDPDSLASILNVGDDFEYNGRTYKVKELSFIRQAEFSQWLKNNAKSEIERSVDLSEETKREMYSTLMQDIAAKKYEYYSKLAVECMRTPEGAAYALYLGLKDEHPTLEPHEAREMYFKKLNEVSKLVYEVIVKNPKSSSPTSSRRGEPSSRGSARERAERRKK